MAAPKQREEFCTVIGMELAEKANVGQAVEFARFLMRSAGSLGFLLGQSADKSQLTPREQKRQAAIEYKIGVECRKYGIGFTFGREPRGASIFLALPSGRTNDLGGRGWAVPR